jgi:hypothetical protein
MFTNFINWVKTHKFTSLLIVAVLYLLFKPTLSNRYLTTASSGSLMMDAAPMKGVSVDSMYYEQNVAPRPEITDRKVITNSNFSLLVKDVTETLSKIKAEVDKLSGYVINSSISRVEYGSTAYVEVRIPSDKLEEFTQNLRSLAVKVVSENVNGTDITDQYVDIQERLTQLEAEKLAFQGFFKNAKTVAEMMEIQQSIFNVQDQIDSYKGRLAYMDGASKTTRLTVSLSTDELGLPYSPINPWRPEAIFKQAVRSFMGTLQKMGTLGIWLVVYSPIIALGLLILMLIKRRMRTPQV